MSLAEEYRNLKRREAKAVAYEAAVNVLQEENDMTEGGV